MISKYELESISLKNNPLGDPTHRQLPVYLPPDYNAKTAYPALLALTGYGASGPMFANFNPWQESLPEKMDRLIESELCPPVIIAMPDCFTKVGGNQYINSEGTGHYEDFLLKEVIPFVEERHAVRGWGAFGISSGGYGSVVLSMRNPDVIQVFANHSGDSNFELCYLADCAQALDAFKAAGGPKKWLEEMWSDENVQRKKYRGPLLPLGMAAHYSPNPMSPDGFDFPFDLETGEFSQKIWERWQAWDPVRLVDKISENAKKIKFAYIDCGFKDEFALHWGARALSKKFKSLGVNVFYEEFDDGHSSLSYRYDNSIPMLVNALSK
jgi:enterochelin esterase-like enzyme